MEIRLNKKGKGWDFDVYEKGVLIRGFYTESYFQVVLEWTSYFYTGEGICRRK